MTSKKRTDRQRGTQKGGMLHQEFLVGIFEPSKSNFNPKLAIFKIDNVTLDPFATCNVSMMGNNKEVY